VWKLVGWFALFFFGVAFVMKIAIPTDPTTRVLVQVWAYVVIGLPIYWAIRAGVKAYRGR
jgi:hypothetical protein